MKLEPNFCSLFNYSLSFLTSFYLSCLMIWWWRNVEKATMTYIHITCIMLSLAFTKIIHIFGIFLHYHDIEKWESFRYSFLWSIRDIPLGFFLFAFALYMTMKIIESKKLINKKN